MPQICFIQTSPLFVNEKEKYKNIQEFYHIHDSLENQRLKIEKHSNTCSIFSHLV